MKPLFYYYHNFTNNLVLVVHVYSKLTYWLKTFPTNKTTIPWNTWWSCVLSKYMM